MSAGMRCERVKKGKKPLKVLVISKFTTSTQICGLDQTGKYMAQNKACYVYTSWNRMLSFETSSWPFFAKAKPLKSQSDDNMIKASVVKMCEADNTGEEASVGVKGQLWSLFMLQQLQISNLISNLRPHDHTTWRRKVARLMSSAYLTCFPV